MLITKREEVTKQGFCVRLSRKLCPRGSLLLAFIHSSGWGRGEGLFEFDWEEEGVGAYLRLGAYLNKYGMSSSSVSNRNKLTYVDWGNIMYCFNENLYTVNSL